MVCLRTEDQTDSRRPPDDFLALCLGHAAGDGDQHLGTLFGTLPLHPADLAQLGIDLLGRLLADVAGIEYDEVSLARHRRLGIAQGPEHIAHALAVIDIHLAAIGLDEDLLRGVIHGSRL